MNVGAEEELLSHQSDILQQHPIQRRHHCHDYLSEEGHVQAVVQMHFADEAHLSLQQPQQQPQRLSQWWYSVRDYT